MPIFLLLLLYNRNECIVTAVGGATDVLWDDCAYTDGLAIDVLILSNVLTGSLVNDIFIRRLL